MLKQKQPYGCGLYAVANSLDRPEFFTEERLEQSITGNTLAQLSIWLNDDGCGYGLDVIYHNCFGEKLPKEITSIRPDGEEILPVLIEVIINNGKGHLMGGLLDHTGKLTVYDSLFNDPFESTLEDINNKYEIVKGLYAFHYTDGRGWMVKKD